MTFPAPQSDHLASRLLDQLSTAVLLLDPSLVIAYMNPAAEVLFQFSARHACGQPFVELLPGVPGVEDCLHLARDGGASYTERELQLEFADNRRITVDCTVNPISFGTSSGLLLELAQVDRHLRISREEHRLAQQEVTHELLRGLAHEVKNPLSGLRGAAQLLERELQAEELKEYTQIIIREADRLQNLVDRMLGPSGLPLREPVNIHEVIERVRALAEAEAPPGVRILRDYDPSIPELTGDADLLIQALLNLVRNALKAVGEEGEVILRSRTQRQFTIGQTKHKLVIRLEVIDDGPGIEPHMMEKIFFPMVSGRPDGSGLGLPIAQSLIARHGGLIECESRPGRTAFIIYLPLESPDE